MKLSAGSPSAENHAHPRASLVPSTGIYEEPVWGGFPDTNFSFEVLKGGTVIQVIECKDRTHLRLGRALDNDVVLEHPSSSRLHAVLQFREGTSECFVFDAGSTHGTFVNKRRLKPCMHAPVFAGDQITFGKSSRVFVVSGTTGLMPEEDPSQIERIRLKTREQLSKSKSEHELQSTTFKSESSAKGSELGITKDDFERDLDAFDRREYGGSFTEKQKTQRERIRKSELKVEKLRSELDCIRAKERGDNPLTVGQRTQIFRNEEALHLLEENIDERDEVLNESIRESIRAQHACAQKKRSRRVEKDKGLKGDYLSDNDDEFYDRTTMATAQRLKKQRRESDQRDGINIDNISSVGIGTAESVSTLREKLQGLETTMQELDAKVESVQEQLFSVETADIFTRDLNNAATDDLEKFMEQSPAKNENRTLLGLVRQVASVNTEFERLTRLLQLADPHGEYNPGSVRARTIEKLSCTNKIWSAAKIDAPQRPTHARIANTTAAANTEKDRKQLSLWEEQGNLQAKRRFLGKSTVEDT